LEVLTRSSLQERLQSAKSELRVLHDSLSAANEEMKEQSRAMASLGLSMERSVWNGSREGGGNTSPGRGAAQSIGGGDNADMTETGSSGVSSKGCVSSTEEYEALETELHEAHGEIRKLEADLRQAKRSLQREESDHVLSKPNPNPNPNPNWRNLTTCSLSRMS